MIVVKGHTVLACVVRCGLAGGVEAELLEGLEVVGTNVDLLLAHQFQVKSVGPCDLPVNGRASQKVFGLFVLLLEQLIGDDVGGSLEQPGLDKLAGLIDRLNVFVRLTIACGKRYPNLILLHWEGNHLRVDYSESALQSDVCLYVRIQLKLLIVHVRLSEQQEPLVRDCEIILVELLKLFVQRDLQVTHAVEPPLDLQLLTDQQDNFPFGDLLELLDDFADGCVDLFLDLCLVLLDGFDPELDFLKLLLEPVLGGLKVFSSLNSLLLYCVVILLNLYQLMSFLPAFVVVSVDLAQHAQRLSAHRAEQSQLPRVDLALRQLFLLVLHVHSVVLAQQFRGLFGVVVRSVAVKAEAAPLIDAVPVGRLLAVGTQLLSNLIPVEADLNDVHGQDLLALVNQVVALQDLLISLVVNEDTVVSGRQLYLILFPLLEVDALTHKYSADHQNLLVQVPDQRCWSARRHHHASSIHCYSFANQTLELILFAEFIKRREGVNRILSIIALIEVVAP